MEGNKPQEMHLFIPPYPYPLPSLPLRPYQTIRLEKNENTEASFPWATSKPATVHTLQYLLSHGLTTITGIVECRNCHAQREIEFDLVEKFKKVSAFILVNKHKIERMIDREPIDYWMRPVAINCNSCLHKKCMMPVISKKKRGINWLFLLLGDMIGCCSVLQLKYFCKHTQNSRNVSKDRLIYFTYLGLCKQLQPEGPYDPPK